MDRSIAKLVSFVVVSLACAPAFAQWVPVQQAPQQGPTYYYAQPQPQWGPAPAPQPQPQWGPAPAPQSQPQWGPGPAPQPQYGYAPPAPAPAVEAGPTEAELEEIRAARRVAAMRPHLLIKGWSGFAGSSTTTVGSNRIESNMPTSPGGAVQVDVPLLPLFAIGGMLGYRTWTNGALQEDGLGDCASVDLNAVGTVRWVFSRTGTNLYGAVPFGLTLNWMDRDRFRNDLSVSTNIGFNIGLLGGIQVMFGRVVGMMFEMGYSYRYASNEISDGTNSVDIDFANSEFVSDLGLVFAF